MNIIMENTNLTLKEIIDVTNGNLVYGNENEECISFERDTRAIKDGDIFIGFKGETVDGGIRYKEALENGAKGCIINKCANENLEKIENKFILEVEDTILATQQIAKLKRKKYNIPVVAITGSVGKTSTKDIIASVVSEKYDVLKTQGNMNNHIGLPMTILGLRNHTAMVVEMGMNHFGEISTLTKIAKPTIAVITNVGTAHIGNLGSRENILKAKLEILEGLSKDGTVVINNDNDLLHKWYLENKNNYNIVTYGIENDSMEKAQDINYLESSSKYNLKNEGVIEVPVGGEAFVYNSLAAISVGKALGISMNKIKQGILKFELTKMRLDVQKSSKGYTIINDCYNANYDSMKSALQYLNRTPGNRKIAVLGDMLELGDFSKKLHEGVGNAVVENKVDILITVGKEAKNIAKIAMKNNVETYEYTDNNSAISKLKEILEPEDAVLVKASNSMNFKEIVSAIM
ncbi:MAG: UDP-N-acetylmuramoyl-tripeptide--D-alanyl-D-alanine ligase [Christensenellales bacterium]